MGAEQHSSSPFEALADATRRAILKRLRKGSMSAGEIAESFPHLSKPTLSHHFRVLRGAGLVRSERQGTRIVYTLQTNVLEDLAAEVLELGGLAGLGGLVGRRLAIKSRSPKGGTS